MTPRNFRFTLLPLAVVSMLACSKTQDTAPERRIFGNPPSIQGVNSDTFFTPQVHIACDFTTVILRMICSLNGSPIPDLEAQPGGGWTSINGQGVVDTTTPSAIPGVFIEGSYGEATFNVKATDPDSTSSQNNILLVSASYVTPEKVENSLVLFDDGSSTKFLLSQHVATPGEDCEIESDGTCNCFPARFPITSGDQTAGDSTYTRKIAFYDPKANPFLLDCIQRDAGETLILTTAGTAVPFKIEATDRQGNLTTWPAQLTARTDSQVNPFKCNGDSCGCCILQFAGLNNQCNNLPGMISASLFPDGICKDVQIP